MSKLKNITFLKTSLEKTLKLVADCLHLLFFGLLNSFQFSIEHLLKLCQMGS